MKNTRYFITGGGTGGHVYPALAVIRELIKNGADKENDIFYLGNNESIEQKVMTSEGLNFLSYKVCGMPRKISLKMFNFLLELLFSTVLVTLYCLKYKPDVVFATGGYVCGPVLIAAKLLKIPYVLHDCDAHPGIVSRSFSSGAFGVTLAYEAAKHEIKCENIKVTGNPIRSEFKTLSKNEAREILNIAQDKFVILIMGGSQGAKTINEAAFSVFEKYKDSKDIHIIWQTGEKKFLDVKERLMPVPANLTVVPYFENMTVPLVAADVAVSRAGSLSLSELCAAKLPSILVPYPYAAADHQRANARNMEKLGASKYLDDNDCTGEKLLNLVEKFIYDKAALNNAAQCAAANAKYDAVEEISALIKEAAKK